MKACAQKHDDAQCVPCDVEATLQRGLDSGVKRLQLSPRALETSVAGQVEKPEAAMAVCLQRDVALVCAL